MTLQKPRRGRNVKKIVGLVCLGALCVGAAIMGVRVTQVAQQTMVEAATTPTPVPAPAANMAGRTPPPQTPPPRTRAEKRLRGRPGENPASPPPGAGVLFG